MDWLHLGWSIASVWGDLRCVPSDIHFGAEEQKSRLTRISFASPTVARSEVPAHRRQRSEAKLASHTAVHFKAT
jgi:hypothetical protein